MGNSVFSGFYKFVYTFVNVSFIDFEAFKVQATSLGLADNDVGKLGMQQQALEWKEYAAECREEG